MRAQDRRTEGRYRGVIAGAPPDDKAALHYMAVALNGHSLASERHQANIDLIEHYLEQGYVHGGNLSSRIAAEERAGKTLQNLLAQRQIAELQEEHVMRLREAARRRKADA